MSEMVSVGGVRWQPTLKAGDTIEVYSGDARFTGTVEPVINNAGETVLIVMVAH